MGLGVRVLDHIRVMLWCTTCVPGMQLPLFAALAGGIFEEYGLEVELIPPTAFRDMTLRGLSVRVDAVDQGAADFAVTGVPYLLAAQAAADGRLGTRFVTSFHQRSPTAGIVPMDSSIAHQQDLAGRSLAGYSMPWMIDEYRGALAAVGLEPGPVAAACDGAYGARSLQRKQVDVVPAWADVIPTMQASANAQFRPVPMDVEVYATGLLATRTVPLEVIARLTDALLAGTALQRAHPEVGIRQYRRRYSNVSASQLAMAWTLYEPNAPTAQSPSMATDRWTASIGFYTHVYGLHPLELDDVCRTELLEAPAPSVSRLAMPVASGAPADRSSSPSLSEDRS